jgi:CDP-diacylglycerol--glycerol-3-phosphate 3-phosphatidyltransferase
MPFNIPIALTWLRIVLIPVFVAVYYLPDTWLMPVAKNWTAMSIFAGAAITDWLDGYLARRWGETSAFGAFLDPVADKLMVAAALILLVQLGRAEAYLAIIIIGREIAISALREWMAQLGKTKNVAVAFIGKVKTASQMTAIIALLLYEPLFGVVPTALLGTIALWVAAILTLWSMFHYLRLAAPYLRGVDGMTELRNTSPRRERRRAPDSGARTPRTHQGRSLPGRLRFRNVLIR